MATRSPIEVRVPARLQAVNRLVGGLRGWLEDELHALRVAQMDDAFFATRKGRQYRPARGKQPNEPASAS